MFYVNQLCETETKTKHKIRGKEENKIENKKENKEEKEENKIENLKEDKIKNEKENKIENQKENQKEENEMSKLIEKFRSTFQIGKDQFSDSYLKGLLIKSNKDIKKAMILHLDIENKKKRKK